MTDDTPSAMTEALTKPPRPPFIERPWLLLHTVAAVIGVGGMVVARSQGQQPDGTEELVAVAVAMFISMGALLAPGLALRAARMAMRRMTGASRRTVLRRLWWTGLAGPATAWLLWRALGGAGWWLRSEGHEVKGMLVMSLALGIAAAAGLSMRYRGRL